MTGQTPSSPVNGFSTSDEALSYYKSQYEQLEAELADFQASSRELETELEKDIEASERRERQLKEKVEGLGYEVDEWKTKYKQSKGEANAAQNTLQKEITALRDTNRTTQLKLRDIEVANDDFERQARHTTSSLEDLDHKYNVAIERGVMLEEEVKLGEQERETLRIECQRLRDELSDLRIENDITKEKLRKSDRTLQDQYRRPMPLTPNSSSIRTPDMQSSPLMNGSSPSLSTPPAQLGLRDIATPPSPPNSETSITFTKPSMAPLFQRARLSISDLNTTPRPPTSNNNSHMRRPSIPRRNPSVSLSRRSTVKSTDVPPLPNGGLPRSGSLYQIRGLIGKMQKLEERVQSARSRLPAPVNTPPRASPRSGSALGESHIPSSVTVRSTRSKRTSASTASFTASQPDETTPSGPPRSRQSFGMQPPQTPTQATGPSRPSSRASLSSRSSISHASSLPQPLTATTTPARPESRQEMSGRRTPYGHRPRSSLSGYSHAHSMSVGDVGEEDEPDADIPSLTPRRTTFSRPESRSAMSRPESRSATARPESRSAMSRPESRGGFNRPAPPSPIKKRVTSLALNSTRRPSSSGLMAPPAGRKLSGVGETF